MALKGYSRLLLAWGVAMMTAGCPGSSLENAVLDITRVAKVSVDQGTSKVMGTVRIPAGALDAQASDPQRWVFVEGATVAVADANGNPVAGLSSVRTDASGAFSFDGVPRGVSVRVRVSVETGDRTYRMQKLLRPGEPLTCSHVDLATTVVADKLLSASPLLQQDPGLQGADLVELFKSEALEDVETSVRRWIVGNPLDPEVWRVGLSQGGLAARLEAIAQQVPGLSQAYHDAFERADSSLTVKIAAVGTNTVGQAPDIPSVSGILTFQVSEAPAGTERVEYWMLGNGVRQKVAEGKEGPAFKETFDSWGLPDGSYSLAPVVVGRDGSRQMLNNYRLMVDNSVATQCPLPR